MDLNRPAKERKNKTRPSQITVLGKLSLVSELWFWPWQGASLCFVLVFVWFLELKKKYENNKTNTHVHVAQSRWLLTFYSLLQVYFLIKRNNITDKNWSSFWPLSAVLFTTGKNLMCILGIYLLHWMYPLRYKVGFSNSLSTCIAVSSLSL